MLICIKRLFYSKILKVADQYEEEKTNPKLIYQIFIKLFKCKRVLHDFNF